ncbi:ATP-binding cassette domain-containing protein [Aeromicrobium sp. CF3.5]|uniref:ATP-binding cassette domain-containing protein n=1 Tax=Aeromicrobium sp. CF3.5 TaxID=3373078 RepID=UPI003EE63E9C
MSVAAIEAHGLVKTFGDTVAVDHLDLRVEPGTVYGLLGPNGAGKTTTVRMLATLSRPDGGGAQIFGHDVVREADEVRSLVSMTGQYASVDEDLTGTENLILLGRLIGHSKSAAAERSNLMMETFGLTEAAKRQVKTYSGGMRRRLDIAASLLSRPKLLFLDEPTTGLDPRSRNQVWSIIRAIVEQGTTVMLTTQYLDEADQLASRIAVIDQGKVIAEGTKGELKSSIGMGSVSLRLRNSDRREDAARLLADAFGTEVQRDPDPVGLSASLGAGTTAPDSTAVTELAAHRAGVALGELARAGIVVDSFALGQPSLDEVFLALTNSPATSHTEDEA